MPTYTPDFTQPIRILRVDRTVQEVPHFNIFEAIKIAERDPKVMAILALTICYEIQGHSRDMQATLIRHQLKVTRFHTFYTMPQLIDALMYDW